MKNVGKRRIDYIGCSVEIKRQLVINTIGWGWLGKLFY